MIISVKGNTKISGSVSEISTDLTMIISAVRELIASEYGEKNADEVIEHIFRTSKMSDEEVVAETLKAAKELLERLAKKAAGKGEQVKADEDN